MKELSFEIMSLLTKKGLTQRSFATEIGVNYNTVNNWFNGKTTARLTIQEWQKIASVLEVDLEELGRLWPKPTTLSPGSGDGLEEI